MLVNVCRPIHRIQEKLFFKRKEPNGDKRS